MAHSLRRSVLLILLSILLAAGCTPSARSRSTAARLAYVGLDDHIYTVPLDGGEPRRIGSVAGEAPLPAGQRLAHWPTWSPDGSRLAFMRFEMSRVGDDRAGIYVASGDGAATRIFESTEDLPIYLSWAPDGASLALLTQQQSDLRLLALDPAGAIPPRELARGGPLYFAWSPDARRLLLHVNGDSRDSDRATLSLVQPSQGPALEPLVSRPADFRAPAWSSDGSRLAFAARVAGGQTVLAIQAPDQSEPSRVALVGDAPVFVWSNGGARLAFSSHAPDETPSYLGLETIKADGTDRQRVTEENVTAFFWSPDGHRLAYISLDLQKRALTWHVADPDGKNQRALASFVPSRDQLFMFSFFDQYAQSHGLWSPDSRYLVFTGSTPPSTSELAAPGGDSSGGEAPSQVFVAAVDGSAPPRVLVDGKLALWPILVSPP
jgi:Tol biopolymer transport system component